MRAPKKTGRTGNCPPRRRKRSVARSLSISLLLLLVGGILSVDSPLGAPPDSASAGTTPEQGESRWIPPRMSGKGFVFLPKGYYSTENKIGVGGELVYPFFLRERCKPAGRLSEIGLKGRLTQELHGRAEGTVELRCGDGKHALKLKVRYDNLSYRFWGIGSDTPSTDEEFYTSQSFLAYLEVFRRITESFRLGIRFEHEQFKYVEIEPDGLLDRMDYRGLLGRRIFGAGLLAEIDTRDNRYSPAAGLYWQAFALFFPDELKSAHKFSNYNMDLRNYFPLGGGNVLATQFFLYAADGSPPIYRLAALGGRPHTRGYRKGRYMDRLLIAFQSEYRSPLVWKLGIVFFGGHGNVAASTEKFRLDRMRPTVGAGLRLLVGELDRIKIRLDGALGENSVRFYLAIGEAF